MAMYKLLFRTNGVSNGPGYYTDQGPEEEEGGWCAAAW